MYSVFFAPLQRACCGLLCFLWLSTAVFAQTYGLVVSTTANRANPVPLAGQTVSGNIYVFITPETGVAQVQFYLDNPSLIDNPRQVEKITPYDFAGGTMTAANSFNTATIADGQHTISAKVILTSGVSQVLNGTFVVVNGYNLVFSTKADRSNPAPLTNQNVTGKIYVFTTPDSGVSQVQFYLDNPTLAGTPRQTEKTPPYDFAGGSTTVANPFNTATIPDGLHTISVSLSPINGLTQILTSSFTTNNNVVLAPYDQIHLAWLSDPATALTVVWRTFQTDTPSTVQYRVLGQTNWRTAMGTLRSSGTTGTLHEVTLPGLTPNTTYEYRVQGDRTILSDNYAVRTAPAAGPKNFNFIYFADTGLVGRLDGLAAGTQQVINEIAALNPLFVLGGGDYAYFNSDTRYGTLDNTIDAWFNQMLPITSKAVIMPTYGNHEVLLGEGYDPWAARFPTPEGFNNRQNYSFDVGDVHFVSILAVYDSQGIDPQALQWVQQDIIAAQQAGKKWIIPFFHVSPFADGTNHPSNLALRAQLGPVFESLGVKVVLSSHDQAYERTYPLINVPATNTPTSTSLTCYTLADGVTWVKTSPGGKLSNKNQGFSQFRTSPPPSWTAFRSNTVFNFVRVTVSALGDLQVDAFGLNGDGTPPIVLDSFKYTSTSCAP